MPAPYAVRSDFRHGQMFAHLTADTQTELVGYARRVGLPLAWLQKSGTAQFHFDVTGRWLKHCQTDAQVVKLTLREFVERQKRKLERNN